MRFRNSAADSISDETKAELRTFRLQPASVKTRRHDRLAPLGTPYRRTVERILADPECRHGDGDLPAPWPQRHRCCPELESALIILKSSSSAFPMTNKSEFFQRLRNEGHRTFYMYA